MVSGVSPQSFREDSLVNERVNMPECRYAMFVQICMSEHGSLIHYYSCFAACIKFVLIYSLYRCLRANDIRPNR